MDMTIVTKDGTEKPMRALNRGEIRAGWKMLMKCGDVDEDKQDFKQVEAVDAYADKIEMLAMQSVGMSQEEFDQLDNEQAEKVVNYVQEQVRGRLNFMKPSQKQENSSGKTNQA